MEWQSFATSKSVPKSSFQLLKHLHSLQPYAILDIFGVYPWPDSTLGGILVQVYIIVPFPSVTHNDMTVQGHDPHCVVFASVTCKWGPHTPIHMRMFISLPDPIIISAFKSIGLVSALLGSKAILQQTSPPLLPFCRKGP